MNKILVGDCLIKLKELEDNSVDSIVTDPPYHLVSIVKRFGKENSAPAKFGTDGAFSRASKGFMGKDWDGVNEEGIGIAQKVELWKECLRVLKPGGHLLAFSGTRTYHRMASAIEDAGFEVRDMIEWVYGSGFPKSLNIGKAVDKLQGNEREEIGRNPNSRENCDKSNTLYESGTVGKTDILTKGTSEWEGWGTALKPAHEPICMARKPLAEKTVAENCLKWGTGGINIDESRVGVEGGTSRGEQGEREKDEKQGFRKNRIINELNSGRFPANLIHDNSEEVRECFPENVKGEIGRAGRKSGGNYEASSYKVGVVTETGFKDNGNASRFFKSIPIEEQDEIQEECTDMEEKLEKLGLEQQDLQKNADEYWNNQSIYTKSIIYQAKASKSERNKGCEELPIKSAGGLQGRADGSLGGEPVTAHNNHPTVKPIALMEYLIRMVTPKGGIVLDPFAGSFSTGVACVKNGFGFVGIEREEEYVVIGKARLEQAQKERGEHLKQTGLF